MIYENLISRHEEIEPTWSRRKKKHPKVESCLTVTSTWSFLFPSRWCVY